MATVEEIKKGLGMKSEKRCIFQVNRMDGRVFHGTNGSVGKEGIEDIVSWNHPKDQKIFVRVSISAEDVLSVCYIEKPADVLSLWNPVGVAFHLNYLECEKRLCR
jgi:hypothetical protein